MSVSDGETCIYPRLRSYKMCFSGSQCAGASSTRARRVAVSLSPGLPHRNVGLGEIRAPSRSGAQVLLATCYGAALVVLMHGLMLDRVVLCFI